jgi:hypothetical protein
VSFDESEGLFHLAIFHAMSPFGLKVTVAATANRAAIVGNLRIAYVL